MSFEETILPFLKEHAVVLVLCTAGVICLGYGLFSISQQQGSSQDQQFQSFTSVSPKKIVVSPTIAKQITIDVEGAVAKPGIHLLPQNSRVQDAILAAGGMSKKVDRKNVAQNLNLAAPLTDGAKLYIPAVGEQMTTSGSNSNNSSGTVQGAATKMVNINQATEADLDALPGVGLVTT